MSQRVGLYGGSFDPVHHGHLIVARSVAEHLGLDRFYLLPSSRPPHKETNALTVANHRAAMVELAVAGEPVLAMSDAELKRHGPSYTIDTVHHFRETLEENAELFWLIGGDWLADLPTWRRAEELVDACSIVTAVRPGWSGFDRQRLVDVWGEPRAERLVGGIVETPMIDISSTDIRGRVRAGRSIRYLVPDSVADYIAAEGLYRDHPA